MKKIARIAGLLLVAGSMGTTQLAQAQTTTPSSADRAIVIADGPILSEPTATTPLRVAATGTSLIAFEEQGGWLRVQFLDPQFGLRTGYIAIRFVRIERAALRPTDLSVPQQPGVGRGTTAQPQTVGLASQGKPVIVVQAFTAATDVELPYDLKLLQPQLVADLKVQLGKEFDVVAEVPATSSGTIYTIDTEITGWRPGNAAKRLVIGLGSGREASDIQYRVTDGLGKKVIEGKETVRTNFFSQGAGSIGTLAHPIAQKLAERIKNARLK